MFHFTREAHITCEAIITHKVLITFRLRNTSLKKAKLNFDLAFFLAGAEGLGLVATTQSRGIFRLCYAPRYGATPKTRFAHFREPRARGSDSPLDCHSLPLPFKSFRFKSQQNKKGHAFLRILFYFGRGRRT